MKMLVSIIVILSIFTMPLLADESFSSKENQETSKVMSEPLVLSDGPYLKYDSTSSAIIDFSIKDSVKCILEYGKGETFTKSIIGSSTTGKYSFGIDDLSGKTDYSYRIKTFGRKPARTSRVYSFNTILNYSKDKVQMTAGSIAAWSGPFARKRAQRILSKTQVTKGYCFILGPKNGHLAYELAKASDLDIICIDQDPVIIEKVRDNLYKAGAYGARISARLVEDMTSLPYQSNIANLIVSESDRIDINDKKIASEIQRVLSPYGVNYLDYDKPPVRQDNTKATSWTHQYANSGNTTAVDDDLGGASGTNQMSVQWVGRPGGYFGLDRNPRMPTPLAINGRLFHQGMDRMIAIDSFNGTVLWSKEMPELRRVNIPRDSGNWCADADYLYVAVTDKCLKINQLNGEIQSTWSVGKSSDNDWGYIATVGDKVFGSIVKKGGIYTEFWGGSRWFDRKEGYGTDKVYSNSVFASDKKTGKKCWSYPSNKEKAIILNSTISINDKCMYFIESKNSELLKDDTVRDSTVRIWQDQYLVCLDSHTGESLWQKPVDTADGTVVFFMVCDNDNIIVTSSAAGKYELYAYDPLDGTQLWKQSHKWPADNHGGHMQHPVIVGQKVFLEPFGYDIKTGVKLDLKMSKRVGCATYCGAGNVLVHRGQKRRLAMWDINSQRISSWLNLRPSCWLSTIIADGLVLSPEGGGGCSCGNWFETSIVFSPKDSIRKKQK